MFGGTGGALCPAALFIKEVFYGVQSGDQTDADRPRQAAGGVQRHPGRLLLMKNVRVVEGEKGLFVSLPSRRNVKGEWTEQCFPMTKELREKLSAVVLAEYDRALAKDGGGTPAA